MREKLSGEGKFNVLITHYDLIMRDKAFLKKIHWYYMIVDEGHRLKNHESVLAKTLVSGYVLTELLVMFNMYKLCEFFKKKKKKVNVTHPPKQGLTGDFTLHLLLMEPFGQF